MHRILNGIAHKRELWTITWRGKPEGLRNFSQSTVKTCGAFAAVSAHRSADEGFPDGKVRVEDDDVGEETGFEFAETLEP